MDYIDEKVKEIDGLDMPSSSCQISNILADIIKHGYSIEQIADISLNLNSYKIIDYLLKFDINDGTIIKSIEDYYKNLKINSNRCLVIADTHIGRIFEGEQFREGYSYCNEYGLYNAYNYAIINNINNIIHLGDLIEGNSNINSDRIDISSQISYLKYAYPVTDSIITYLLYGNHDYNSILYDKVDHNFYRVCKNVKLIGINYSYIYFNDYLIKLSHYSKLSDYYKSIDLPHNFEIAGHSHLFNVSENDRYINVPSLSLLSNNTGFLEMINEENEFVFKLLDKDAKHVCEKVLSK